MTLRDYLASLVRTVVPIAVGLGLAWVADKTGLNLPAEPTTEVVTGLVAAGYYAAVRAAEARWSWVGWLLGYAVSPTYAPAETE